MDGEQMPRAVHGARRRIVDAHLPPVLAVGIAAAITVLIAAGDYLTGPYLVFATFYLVPVVIVSWYVGRGAGFAFAALAAVSGAVSPTPMPPRPRTLCDGCTTPWSR